MRPEYGIDWVAGQTEGRVRIVNSPEEDDQLQPGEILVAVTTNVGWTPLFPRIVAVVTDVGALLNQRSIVAREYGIPAMMATRNATRHIKSRQMFTVDGKAGTVTLN